jgi:hypothetical protein
MALTHSPSVATNGLVFYYDMGNPQKSWQGKPTINYIPYPYASYNNGAFVLGYNYPNLGATYTYVTDVSNPVNAPGVMQYYTGTSGYKFFSIDSTTVPTTGTYTFSYYARLISGPASSSNLGNAQLWRDSILGDQAVTGDWNPTYTTNWTRYSTQGPVQAGSVLQYFPIHSGVITGDYTIQYCGFQIELNSFATPLAIGTRSTTQALLDLTNNNTWTVNNLTYSSDQTFSFNGSNSWIESPTSSVFDTQTVTMESWCYPTVTAQSGFLFEKGQVNTQYSNFFNGDGTFYFRTMGLSPQDQTFASASYITANAWNHIVCTYGNGTKTIYINGVQIAQQTGVTGTIPTGQTNQYVGKFGNAGNNYPFNGKIAVSKVYNRSLSVAEVNQNFNALRGRYGI